jgi:tetratricopeptide (TPR) repeat protein
MSTSGAFQDRYGLPLSTGSQVAAARYVEAIDRLLSGNPGGEALLDDALTADDGFALAHAARARALQFRGLTTDAKQAAARARACAAGTTRRERGHVAAITAAIETGGAAALTAVREHSAEFPRDAYVLSQASGVYGLIGFSGRQDRNQEQYALLAGVADAYGDDWWFLSAYGFAHTELFRFDEGRRLIERSLAIYGRNGHAAHALAHVFYESGDTAAGTAFLTTWLPDYARAAALHCHLSWHLALFALASGQYRRAMAIYEGSIGPPVSQSQALGTLADAASLLWRWSLYGRPVDGRWAAVQALAAGAFPNPGTPFADVHAALAYAATRDEAAMCRLLDGLRERLAAGRLPAGEVVIDLILGIDAFARGEYAETVRLIAPAADQIVRIGGSHAQRDVLEETLLVACLRAGHFERALALLSARLDRRHSVRDLFWLSRAQAALGRGPAADESLREALRCWQSADPDAPERAALTARGVP